MAFCVECGTQVQGENKFCPSCGKEVGQAGMATATHAGNSGKLDNLYKVARRARADGNNDQALRKYEELLSEDPDNWEPNFYTALYTGINSLTNDSPGSSVRISGGQVSLGYNYRSGLTPCIRVVHNCLDGVFSLIESIEDYNEQTAAADEVCATVVKLGETLLTIIDNEHARLKQEIAHYISETNEENSIVNKGLDKYNMNTKNDLLKSDYRKNVESMVGLVESRQRRLKEVIAKRRFDEYWEEHKEEKAALLSEKESLRGQVAKLYEDIEAVPGRKEMLDSHKQLEQEKDGAVSAIPRPKTGLLSSIRALSVLAFIVSLIATFYWIAEVGGLYGEAIVFLVLSVVLVIVFIRCGRLKAKKMKPYLDQQANIVADFLQKQQALNEKYAPVTAAVAKINKAITPLEGKIDRIDNELTRPR